MIDISWLSSYLQAAPTLSQSLPLHSTLNLWCTQGLVQAISAKHMASVTVYMSTTLTLISLSQTISLRLKYLTWSHYSYVSKFNIPTWTSSAPNCPRPGTVPVFLSQWNIPPGTGFKAQKSRNHLWHSCLIIPCLITEPRQLFLLNSSGKWFTFHHHHCQHSSSSYTCLISYLDCCDSLPVDFQTY